MAQQQPHHPGKYELLKEDELRARVPKSFEIKALLGTGSFSYVFKVVDKTKIILDPVAIKIIGASRLNRSHVRSSAHEISIMGILRHPNILKLISFHLTEYLIYMVLELAPFGSLYDMIKSSGSINEDILQMIMKQLASALDYMHAFNLIHGDIKPDNILITENKNDNLTIKICDFGLSVVKLADCREFKFKSGSFFYMAPEVHFGYDVDCHADIWSLGVVMYKCMFNRKIYPVSDTERDKFKFLMQCRTPITFEGHEKYSDACVNFLKSLLVFNKSSRWDTRILSCHNFITPENKYDVTLTDEIKFLEAAANHIHESFKYHAQNDYGNAIVFAFQAILELKIHYNMLVTKDAVTPEQKKPLFEKIAEYKEFAEKLENELMLRSSKEKDNAYVLSGSNAEIRRCLSTTPALLQAFDIALTAEMYDIEGRLDKAMDMYTQAISVMLKAANKEPPGQRRDLIGQLVKMWISKAEILHNLHYMQID